MANRVVIETPRLRLRWLTIEDAPVMLNVLNDPSFVAFVGDKGVRTEEQARTYLESGPIAMYAECGFGQYLVELRTTGAPAGICGLIKREELPHADVGFALFPAFQGQGLAFEAASAVLDHARTALGMGAVLAITHQDNVVSQRLLEKLGLRFVRLVGAPSPLKLYAISWGSDLAFHHRPADDDENVIVGVPAPERLRARIEARALTSARESSKRIRP